MAKLREAQLIRPILEVLSDGRERNKEEIDRLAEERLGLSQGDLRRDGNEVDWAKSTLTRNRCVADPRNPGATKNRSGVYQITDRGRDALEVLRRYPDFQPPIRQAFGGWLEDHGVGIRPGLGSKWQEAIRLCREILSDRERFEREEVAYKRLVAEHAQAALYAATSGGALRADLFDFWRAPNNLLFHIDMTRFAQWIGDDEEGARGALVALHGEGSRAERVESFAGLVPSEVLRSRGAQLSFASVFLMGLDPAHNPPLKVTPLRDAERILAWRDLSAGATVGQEYEHHLAFLEGFREKLVEGGLDVPDTLAAQGLFWILMTSKEPQYRAFRGQAAELGPPASDSEPSELAGLARELYVDVGWLRDVVKLLEGKRQLIFYGPPGTGKTYIARKLARFLADGDLQGLEVVQFHPSYSYEDFVQGYRPRSGPGGTLSYKLADGPLIRLARAARAAPESRHILLIDEINRGNLPRIFGELLYLLEYRDEEVSLMYGEEGEEHFSLPENLWVLGTMNTADGSIGLIDAALRRRFHFVPLFPGEPPVDGLLGRWLSDESQACGMSPRTSIASTPGSVSASAGIFSWVTRTSWSRIWTKLTWSGSGEPTSCRSLRITFLAMRMSWSSSASMRSSV